MSSHKTTKGWHERFNLLRDYKLWGEFRLVSKHPFSASVKELIYK